jgi:hypothetical protein
MTVPGVETATLYVNFGQLPNNLWEIKKVDKILITWDKEPKDYRVFSWYPGSSWVMIYSVKNNGK